MTFDEIRPYVAAAARHLLTTAAGALVTSGALQKGQQSQFIAIGAGIAVWGAGFAWSWWQKNCQNRQVSIALATQPPPRT